MKQNDSRGTITKEKPADTSSRNKGYFFSVVSLDTAIEKLCSIAHETGTESIPLDEADGRVLAEPVYASSDIPGFDRSWKDGYAVIAADTPRASEAAPVLLTCTGAVEMGSDDNDFVAPGQCRYIPTGGVLPKGADAVVMIEYTERLSDTILIRRPAVIGENIIRRDEDFSAGDCIFEAGWVLRPQDIGVLAAIGKTFVAVVSRPRIGVISTGRELVGVDATPRPGQVRDVNASLIAAMLRRKGAVPVQYGIVFDDETHLVNLLSTACRECDAVLVSGGSSKDEKDITATAIEACGTVHIHGISLAPGKPTIIGSVANTPVVGLPGHPASTCLVLLLVVAPLLQVMEKRPAGASVITKARMAENVPAEKGRETYIRVRVENGNVTPLFGKSGLLNTLKESDGILRVPAGVEGLEAGELVEVIQW